MCAQGKRFESGWSAYLVGIYANILFYYEKLDELPRGVVPLAACSAKAVDRIFRNSDASGNGSAESYAEDCGPCWKVTSRAGRVLLFRSPSVENRQVWLDRIHFANVEHPAHRQSLLQQHSSFEGSGRRRRSSSSSSSASTSRLSLDESQLHHGGAESYSQQHHQRRRRPSREAAVAAAAHEVSEMLRDAMQLVKKQKQEILDLKSKLKEMQDAQDLVAALAVTPVEADDALVAVEDELRQEDEEKVHAAEMGVVVVEEEEEKKEEEVVMDDEKADARVSAADDDLHVVVPAAPLSAPASLAGFQETDPTFTARHTHGDVASTFSASMGSFDKRSGSGNEYLQQQAMELAEIARNLKSSFRTDFAVTC